MLEGKTIKQEAIYAVSQETLLALMGTQVNGSKTSNVKIGKKLWQIACNLPRFFPLKFSIQYT